MHIILTGATGFIGGEVLRQCIQQPKITNITVLTRRALSEAAVNHAKVRTVITNDFTNYDIDLFNGIDACIWCLGRSIEADLTYPVAFAKAMSGIKLGEEGNQPFRFVLCSGVLAERDQQKSLWFMQEGRRAKGSGEIEILNFAKEKNAGRPWESYVMRPSMVLPVQANVLQRSMSVVLGGIQVDDLAKAAMLLAMKGHHSDTFENAALVKYAQIPLT